METYSVPPADSVTTGLPSPTPRDENSIGPQSGEFGYGRMPNECADPESLEPGTARWDSFMEVVRVREAKREVEVRQLKDSARGTGCRSSTS